MSSPPSPKAAPSTKPDNVEAHVCLSQVGMCFGSRRVLEGVDLLVAPGKIAVVIGGSGTGKTTLLRILIGLQRPTVGQVCIDGQDIAGMDERALREVRSRCGMVFQYSALLDSLTVFDNVALPLREHERLTTAELASRVREMLDAVGLAGTESQLPNELSGGMRKRVGLARALIRRPKLMVYDEPASGLDPLTARRVDDLILQTSERFGVTSIVISHSMTQALRIADQLHVLDAGRVVASGEPRALCTEPGSLAAQFYAASQVE